MVAPDTPARPVPELHPATRSLGKRRRNPSRLASPKDDPVPMMKLGISVRRNPVNLLSCLLESVLVKFKMTKRLMYPQKKYTDRKVILKIYETFIQNFELIILAKEEKAISALIVKKYYYKG